MNFLEYIEVNKNNLELMDKAYFGDAVIRMWLRARMRHDFVGRGGRNHESFLNANVQMIEYAKPLFPNCTGKRVADNFEAFIAHMHDNNYVYDYLLEDYYQNYMLTRPVRKKFWHSLEFKCPLLNHLRKKNKL